jgi:putative ABC transport system permease protein
MISQTFYMFFRRFSKDSLFAFINLANLIVGFATFILLSQFISGQFNYDRHHVNYERIYRVQLFQDQKENRVRHSSSITAALSRHELPKLPEIEKITLLHDVGDNNKNGVFLSIDKKNQFLTRYGFYADASVFEIFTFSFLEGSSQNALTQPFSIVLSKTLANKLFPFGKALGSQVYGENKAVLTVTGVYEDFPAASSWKPAYLLPMLSFTALTGWKDYEDNYWAYSFYTYVLLKPNADPAAVDNKIHDALKDYRKEHFPYLRPMSKLYVNPYFQKDMYIALGLFTFIAILILLLSAINFINLQTANATTRFREIGIKKTVGFTKKQLWLQFIFESVFTAIIACIFGLIAAQLAMPSFNRMIGEELLTNVFTDGKLIIIIVSLTLLTGFLSGIYPAYAISAYNPVKALKQKYIQEENNGITLKKILVTGQFSISLFLLIVSAIIYQQTQYMLNKDMGFESHNLMFANIVTNNKGSFNALRQNLLSHPEIIDACVSDYIPFVLPGGDELMWEGALPDEKVFVRISNISYDFVPTFDMQISAGRNFSREFPSDAEKCLINETAVQVFGWKEPVGKLIKVKDKDVEVVGVISDYIVFSVHNPTEPHMYRLLPDSLRSDAIYSIRFKQSNDKQAMQIAREEFSKFFPGDAFEFRNIQSLIRTENATLAWKKLMKVSVFFAVFSIVISSIGLFGLILFYTRRKMKEIGIRKVLGFSTISLFYTMSSGFIKLLFISIIIAWPTAYEVYKFLPGSNKYPIRLWEFLMATLIILLVAIATMSLQIGKAIRTRPVDVLKDE